MSFPLPGTGDEGLRFRGAAELPGLDLIVNWAKRARLARKQGARLVPAARARPVLADAEALGSAHSRQRSISAVPSAVPSGRMIPHRRRRACTA